MELYRVSLEWKDVSAEREWEKRMGEAIRRSSLFTEPRPPRKTHVAHVAVFPDFGGSPVGRAADLACETYIGARARWETYEVMVLAVEHVGAVSIEEEEEKP